MSINKSSLGFVFPGQGSQTVGMLADLADSYPLVQQTFEEASESLGRDLWKIAQQGPSEELNMTQNTQPSVLTAGVALWRVWQTQSDLRPNFMAGHSLGEYTALVCSNSISFVDAVKLVEQRATFMQQAVPEGEGAMAAVLGLDVDKLIAICQHAAQGEIVSAVNFNAPGQVVIAGNTAAVERAIAEAKEHGAKRALPLPVSVPSHCELMRPASEKLLEVLSSVEVSTPDTMILHNTDVLSHQDPDDIKQALAKQLYTPVRWTETIEKLGQANMRTVVECGPGKVLSGLNKRIDKSLNILSVADESAFTKTLEALS